MKIIRRFKLAAFTLSVYLSVFFVIYPVMAQSGVSSIIGSNLSKDSSNVGTQKTFVPSLSDSEKNRINITPSDAYQQQVLRMQSIYDASAQRIKVHVLGEVEHPSVYTQVLSSRVSDVLLLATPKRPTTRIIQVRHPGEKTRYYDLYRYFYFGDVEQNPYLKDNDVVFVSKHRGAVRIEGPVARPGLYELSGERDVQDVINLAGGMSSSASKVNPVKIVRFADGGKKFVLDVDNAHNKLSTFKIKAGDIIVVPDLVNLSSKFDYTVESIPGENMFYPTATPEVFVMGQVNSAGAFSYKSHLRVKDYVAYANPTVNAKMKNVTLIRNGKNKKVAFDSKPRPGDILMVKTKPSFALVVTTVSTALSLALTAVLIQSYSNSN